MLFQNVPKIALAPLLILWFGYDLLPKIALIVIMAFFPVTLNMLVGLRLLDANLMSLLQSIGATPGQIMARVKIPSSLPALMAGMKVAITLSVIGAIVGEFVGAYRAGLHDPVRLQPDGYGAGVRRAGADIRPGRLLLLPDRAGRAAVPGLGGTLKHRQPTRGKS
ncbi:ABC transporter permease subunit [Achromobacter xylosoxidans]